MPNVKSQVWYSDDGLPHLMIQALRRIEKNERLTFNYRIALRTGENRMKCLCGKVNCVEENVENKVPQNKMLTKKALSDQLTYKCYQCNK